MEDSSYEVDQGDDQQQPNNTNITLPVHPSPPLLPHIQIHPDQSNIVNTCRPQKSQRVNSAGAHSAGAHSAGAHSAQLIVTIIKPIESRQNKQCRICLQGESEGRLITPCKCIGTVQYTHSSCLSQWILRKVQIMANQTNTTDTVAIRNRIRNLNRVFCELCSTQFIYTLHYSRELSWQNFVNNYQDDKLPYITFIIINILTVLVTLAGIIFVALISTNQQIVSRLNQRMSCDDARIIILCFMVIVVFIISICDILFIADYAGKVILEVKGLGQYYNLGNNNSCNSINENSARIKGHPKWRNNRIGKQNKKKIQNRIYIE